MATALDELKATLGSGLLSFPATHFDEDGGLDLAPYQRHVEGQVSGGAAALFAAAGTGEFFSLTLGEFERTVSAAAEVVGDRMPLVAGCGYGTAAAIEFAQAAERAGAGAILLLPPYLLQMEQAGLVRHVQKVAGAVGIGVIVYSRDNGIFTPDSVAKLADSCPNLIGYKDGVGDLDQLTRIVKQVGERLVYVGGVPTAEMLALPYFSVGVSTYSSAVYNFMPAFALAFYEAARKGDRATVDAIYRDFFFPYSAIRARARGYAVSIVKAGLKIVGQPAGPVRAPLVDLTPADMRDLAGLIAKAGGRIAAAA